MRIHVALMLLVPAVPALMAAQPAASAMPLGFEEAGAVDPSMPRGWVALAIGAEVGRAFGGHARSGTASLRIEHRRSAERASLGMAQQVLPATRLRRRRVALSGWIRTKDVRDGYAGLFLRADDLAGRQLQLVNMEGAGLVGTRDWTAVDVAVEVHPQAAVLRFGALHSGRGTAWFDDLALRVEDRPLHPRADLPVPSDAALAALAAQVVAPDGDAVRALAAGARVVAFGESTHGTREFAVLRADLTRALRSPRDTLDLVLEANMTAVGDLDRWIRTGQGDDAAAVEALGYWTWRTDEMRAMARALRERVARGHGLVRVWGVDIQDPDAALEGVRAYVERRGDARLRADLDAVASAVRPLRSLGARLLGTMDTTAVTRALATTSRLVASLEQVRSATGDADPVASRWAVQQARLLAQWSAMLRYGPAARDSAMAQNVLWILAQRTSSTPLVLWAHDGHVARETGTMGSVLAQRLGSGYRPVSLSMYQGRYSASGPAGLTGYDALPATAGTLEEGLHRLGRPSLLLDLRATGSEARPWLGAPLLTRRIGAVALESGYLPMVPAASFDALVFVDSTTRTSLRPSGSLARRWPTLLVMGGVSLLLLVGVWKSRRPRPSVVVLNAPRGASLA